MKRLRARVVGLTSTFVRHAGIVGLVALGTAATASMAACSVLLDWTGYTGETEAGSTFVPDSGTYRVTCGPSQYCAPPPPPGWTGPVAFADVAADAAAPACGAAYSLRFRGSAGLNFPPAICTCSCSPPMGTTCPMPEVAYFSDSNCMNACGTPTTLSNCSAPPAGCSALKVASAMPEGGSCSPTDAGVTMTVPPATWSRQSLECVPSATPEGKSCGAGELCLPAPPPSLGFCVSQAGAATECPAGSGYTQGPFVEYPSAKAEGRTCSDCLCDPPTGGSCTQPGGFIVDSQCATPAAIPLVPSHCFPSTVDPIGVGAKTYSPATVASAGACAARTLAGGTVTPAGAATTFCCAP